MTGFEIQDHNIAAGYVTYIVDIWDGDRDDPAVGVNRYLGVWQESVIMDTEHGQPEFDRVDVGWSYAGRLKPPAAVWQVLKEVKESVREAEQHQSEHKGLMSEGYSYGAGATRKSRYQKFMAAIDTLVTDPENEQAWQDIDAWRNVMAMEHER